MYRNVFFYEPKAREMFEMLCVYAERFSKLIPITFLTGFYVSQVVNRWWDQFMSLPWPDRLALKLVSFCPGTDDFKKNLRRTVMRYVNLSSVLVYRLVSEKVMTRFPDYQSLVQAKLMLPHEVSRLEKADHQTPHESTYIPILWAMKLLTRARMEGKIQVEAPIFANLQNSFDSMEAANRKILNYGWVNFPLAYVQVATISVQLYFLANLFGRQYLTPSEAGADTQMFPNLTIPFSSTQPFNTHTPDFYIPFFTLAEFFCYMGWIKVAETLLNPFGDDDEDFQINYLIDRNLQVSYMIVDEADRDIEMAADPFLEAGIDIPKELPYRERKTSLRMKISGRNNDPNSDNLSIAGSVASAARATSNTMISITRLQQFRRKFGSRTNVNNSLAVPGATNANQDDVIPDLKFGGSMPPLRTQPLETLTTIQSIPGSNESNHDEMKIDVSTDVGESGTNFAIEEGLSNPNSYFNAAFEAAENMKENENK